MHSTMGTWVFVGLSVMLAALIVAMFYLLTLMRALQKCSPQSRTMQPGMVWLLLIPLFNLIWQFFVVMGLSNSLGNEFRARGMVNAPQEPGKQLGLAMSVCAVFGMVPYVRFVAGVASLVLWILYWVKIAEFSRMLDVPAGMGMQASDGSGGMRPGV